MRFLTRWVERSESDFLEADATTYDGWGEKGLQTIVGDVMLFDGYILAESDVMRLSSLA